MTISYQNPSRELRYEGEGYTYFEPAGNIKYSVIFRQDDPMLQTKEYEEFKAALKALENKARNK